jgi:hypothetical protein
MAPRMTVDGSGVVGFALREAKFKGGKNRSDAYLHQSITAIR